jgi:multidrug efflux pump subunit AcrA (membrane-fusion protein)
MAGEVMERGIDAPQRQRPLRIAIRLLLLLLLAAAGVAAYRLTARTGDHSRAATDLTLVPVTVGTVTARDMPIWLSGIGSVQPINAVTVKVRVDGQLERVLFTEGQEVRDGDVLAEVDPRPYQAQLDQAVANKARDQAQLANAAQDVQAAINAASGTLPKNLPQPPVYWKSNPADFTILSLALTSDTLPLTEVDRYAEDFIAPQVAQMPGVGLVD